METYLRWTATCATAAVIAGLGGAAEAAVIQITAGTGAGTVVFDSGGYEAGTVGSNPSGAAVGTYEFNNANGVTVGTGPAADGLTAAASGNNYLSIDRTASGANSNSWINHIFAQPIDTTASSFTLTYAWWGSGDDMSMTVGGPLADSPTNATLEVLHSWGQDSNHGPGGTPAMREFVTAANSGNGTTIFDAASLTIGEWNTVVYAWDHTTSSGTLTVNGVVETLGLVDSPASVTQLHVRSGTSAAQVYIDSVVPEPGSLGLLVSGGLLVLARKRRN